MKARRSLSAAFGSLILLGLTAMLCRCGSGQEAPPPYQPAVSDTLPRASVPASCGGVTLVVLGIAQDAGYPQADCRKDCCKPAWQDPTRRRRVVSLGLADPAQQKYWIFEATPDFPEQWKEMSERFPGYQLGGIFVSHAHIGHYTGLMYLGREAVGASDVPVFAMPRMAKFLQANGPWSQLVELGNIRIIPLTGDTGHSLGGDLTVTPIPVPHRDEFSETVGFRISIAEKQVLFLPDIDKWQKWDRDLVRELQSLDLAFLDATFYANGEIPGRDMSEIPHPFVEETLELLAEQPDSLRERVCLIHFNHTNPLLNPQAPARKAVTSQSIKIATEGELFCL